MRRLQALPEMSVEAVSPQIAEILSKPFRFLGRGRQCFAFESLDGLYILKCPRTDIYRIPFWARLLPVQKRRQEMQRDKLYRKTFVWNSFRLAKTALSQETGTIALHLGTSPVYQGDLTLIDALGFTVHIPLHKTCFILQYKHKLWTPQFLHAHKTGNTAEKKRLLNALIDAMEKRARKGILNRDRSFLRNYGFDGVCAYQIDIGDFYKLPTWYPEQVFLKSVHDSAAPVQEWLATLDPSLLEMVKERLNALQFEPQAAETTDNL